MGDILSGWGQDWRGWCLALIAGALVPLSLAPFDIWPLGLISLTLFAALLPGLKGRGLWLSSFCFGLGLYGSGASWVFVSIHSYGNTPLALALIMTSLFVIFLAFIFSLPWPLLARLQSSGTSRSLSLILGFPALWVLGEWLRAWLLTGFPWLYIGYGHLDTWLAGWVPVGSVMAASFILALSAAVLASFCLSDSSRRFRLGAVALTISAWIGGAALQSQQWTKTHGDTITVGMVQPNIPQELKWAPSFREPTLDRLRKLSEPLWAKDWLIWPEAAIPMLYHEAMPFLLEIDEKAQKENTSLVTGILYDDYEQRKYFNSVLGLGMAMGLYHKQRLVPFGEYVPMEEYLRGIISFFDLPTSVIHPGPPEQNGLRTHDQYAIAPSICYEVVYPSLVAEAAKDADVLLTISNDAWFGSSIGPLQHMQMAQMRALETGRYMIRSTNNGVSGIIDSRGKLLSKSEQFKRQTLSGEVRAMRGATPFMRWGNSPLLALCVLLLAALLAHKHSSGKR